LPDSKVVKAFNTVGNPHFMHPDFHGGPPTMFICGNDGEAKKAVMDMFWGDRYGQLKDPFGHIWSIATHNQDLSQEEIQKAGEEALKEMMAQKKENVG
jgi:hypothetical protein